MRPDATLLVDMGPLAGPFELHPERYPDAVRAHFDGVQFTDERLVRSFLERIDVCYTAETMYDLRLPTWCAEHGVRLAVHINPEFWKLQAEHTMWSSVDWWAPTSWRLETLPVATTVMPVPVPLDRWEVPAPEREHPVFLHVAGHRAAADRNGTSLVLAALQRMTGPLHVRLVTQGERLPIPKCAPGVEVEIVTGGVDDYWRLYDDADVMLLPRRYGGLCLPANEAAGAGLALVMTDCPPNLRWPVTAVKVAQTTWMEAPCGQLPIESADVTTLAHVIRRHADDHEHRHQRQRRARQWAREHSWDASRATILEQLACG
jgi:glycosyltransferase involved in cell wall biosynthesis